MIDLEESVSQLVSLYELVKTGGGDGLDEATQKWQEINQNPESIFIHLNLISTNSDDFIIKQTMITLKKLIPLHIKSLSHEQILQLQSFIIDFLQKETDFQLFSYSTYVITSILNSKTEEFSIEWPEIFDYSLHLLEQETTIVYSLHLWNSIISFLSQDLLRPTILKILKIIIEILQNSSDLLQRNESLNFIRLHMIRIEEPQNDEEKSILDQVIECLYTMIMNINSKETGNCLLFLQDEEKRQLVDILCYFYGEQPPFFSDSYQTFLEGAIQICNSEECDIESRVLFHNIIEAAAFFISTDYQESLVDIITNSVHLSIQVCTNDRESMDYQFPLSFFFALSSAYDAEQQELYSIFMQIIHDLIESNEIIAKQIALLTLRSIIEGLQEVISANFDDFLSCILTASSSLTEEEKMQLQTNSDAEDEDEILLLSGFETIRELTDFLPDSLNKYVEQLTGFLVEHSYLNEAISTLDNIFYKVEKPPFELEGLITALTNDIQDASSYRIELILSCLTSSFSHSTEVDESVYEVLNPFLTELLSSKPDLRGPVLECYGRMAHISPQSILQELGNIIDLVEESFSIEDFPIENSCVCIEQLAEVFSISLNPFIDNIVPPLFAIIQDENLVNISSIALKTLAKLLGFMPESLSEYQPRIVDYLMKKPFEDKNFIVPCCEGIAFAVDGFNVLHLDPSIFITTFLPIIKGAGSKDAISAVLMVDGTVFSSCITVSQEIFEFSSQIFISALKGEFINLKRSDISNELDPQLIHPLFYSINQFILASNPDFVTHLIEPFFEILRENLEKENSLHCYTLNLFSNICSHCNLTNELFNITLSNLIESINQEYFQINELNKLNLSSLSLLLKIGKDQMQSYAQILYEKTFSIIQQALEGENESISLTKTSVSLFCQVIQTYELDIDMELLSDIMTLLPPPIDSDEIVTAASFVPYLISHSLFPESIIGISLNLLASSDWYLHMCDQSILSTIFQVVSQLDEEIISQNLKFNERHILIVHKRLESKQQSE